MERYNLAPDFSDMNQCGNGEYVKYADAQATKAALQAQVLENQCKDTLIETLQASIDALQRQVEERTAELEAAKADKVKWEEIASLRFAGDHKFAKEMESLKVDNAKLHAELERVTKEAATIADTRAAQGVEGGTDERIAELHGDN